MGVARIVLLALALPSAATASMADLLRAPPKSRESVKRMITIPSSLGNGSVGVPALIYASEYKRHQTRDLVGRALRAGFRAVDTAAGEGHRFNETAVGDAVRAFPESVFLQLKVHHVTPPKKRKAEREPEGDGPAAARRVGRALAGGLRSLGVASVDALLLRGPSAAARRSGELADADVAAWREMQRAALDGRARLLGVCNFPPKLLEQLLALDGPRCRLHQTKVRADRAWNREDRVLAAASGVLLQAPNLISGNGPAFARGRALHEVAVARSATPESTALKFAVQLGVVPVVGATSAKHIRDDLTALDGAPLTDAEVAKIEWAFSKTPGGANAGGAGRARKALRGAEREVAKGPRKKKAKRA